MNKNTIPPSHASNAWHAAFPLDEARQATEFLVQTWHVVSVRRSKAFVSTLRENQITEVFAVYLCKLSGGDGRLTGFWSYEEQAGSIDEGATEDAKVVNRIRKDIVYKSNKSDARLELIYEFKKLHPTPKSCRIYKGTDGMRRFVDGEYAKGLPSALMVGMVIGDCQECEQILRTLLSSAAENGDLKMVPNADGEVVLSPSTVFPALATFDTAHQRPADRAFMHGPILLSHLLLPMPAAV